MFGKNIHLNIILQTSAVSTAKVLFAAGLFEQMSRSIMFTKLNSVWNNRPGRPVKPMRFAA